MSEWWKRYIDSKSRTPVSMPPGTRPDFVAGETVRLRGKPGRSRRVLWSEWHRHRAEVVYIIETDARHPFAPYWFLEQLERAGEPQAQ